MSQRILALDIGEKRTGIAISDPLAIIAQPYKTIYWKSKKELLQQIIDIIKSESVKEIIVGLPLSLKGSDSDKTREVRNIITYLKENLEISIITEDERFTTVMAHRTLHALGKKPSRLKAEVDRLAAVYILESYLNRRDRQSKTQGEQE